MRHRVCIRCVEEPDKVVDVVVAADEVVEAEVPVPLIKLHGIPLVEEVVAGVWVEVPVVDFRVEDVGRDVTVCQRDK